MDTLKRITVLLLAAALVYAGAAALHPPQARAGINAGVVVNNPASQPVPITGSVDINGTSTVQFAPGSMVKIEGLTPVTVKGISTVQLAPGSAVGVTGGTINFNNTPLTPVFTRDIDNPATAPFQTTLCHSSIGPCTFQPPSFVVAPKQRFVIEYVGGSCNTFNTGSVLTGFTISTQAGGLGATYLFPPGQPFGGQGNSISTQQVRIYADPGTEVRMIAEGDTNSPSGAFECFATLSGYLVTQ